MTLRARPLNPQVTFVLLAVLINVLASAAVAHITDPARHRMAEWSATLDMTLTVTALYYWLIVRPGLRHWNSLFFIALMGLLRASFAFPAAFPAVIPGKLYLGVGAEVCLVAALVLGLRRARNLENAAPDADPVERINSVLAGLLPFAAAARALSGELSVLYYAFAWRAKPHVPAGATAFTLHKRSGFNDLLLIVVLGSLLEVGPVHVVVGHWSKTAAWIVTGLSIYGALCAVALSRSLALRPTLVTADEILVRFGLLFSLRIPRNAVLSVGRLPLPDATVVPRNAQASLFIAFTLPLEATR